jgi:hypothetical protein
MMKIETSESNFSVEKTIFTNQEAAEFLRLSQVSLWRLRKAGKITFRRVASKIMYLREDLDGYLERGKCDAVVVETSDR